jgi:23S rRNA (pseudouridine1915-N3)-methyltransferase
VALGPLTVAEIGESRLATPALRKADEAAKLLKAAAASDAIVALDETGRGMPSVDFAALLSRYRDSGVQRLACLIGGPDGHGPPVIEAAKLTLSLGPMTLPHGLARVILAEQLYRVSTILSGHPYHRA